MLPKGGRGGKGERKIEERKMMQTDLFHPLCLRLSNMGMLVMDRLGAEYDRESGKKWVERKNKGNWFG